MFLYVLVNVFLVPVAFDEGAVTAATCKSKCEGERVSCVSECADDNPDTDENEYDECVKGCASGKAGCLDLCGGCESNCRGKSSICVTHCFGENRDDEDALRECCTQCSKDHAGCYQGCGVDVPDFSCNRDSGI